MRNIGKKLLGIVAAATLFASLGLTACGDGFYSDKVDGYDEDAKAVAVSNGGFAVERGKYIYYINGMEDYSVSNKYGDVVKGSLMRIEKTKLEAGDYASADVVVPMLFVSQNFDAGIYIYGDYVYYATPTTDKDSKGNVVSSWIDFKRAKLDGSETMKGYFFRLSDNAAKYRFVEVDGVVYCMYEESGTLKSYNTASGATTVLVEGATSFFYDKKDLTNPNVYYTMGVTNNLDSNNSSTATYNQIYSVNAASYANVNASEASYEVMVYDEASDSFVAEKKYSFDKNYLDEQNAKAKETAKENDTKYEATYVYDDYTTYPYVNLGTLVLDGMGRQCDETQFNVANAKTVLETLPNHSLKGYTYTVARYENGGVYYTQAGETTDSKLYYYAENTAADNAIVANTKSSVIAYNTTEASATALFLVTEGVHEYIYIDTANSKVVKATVGANGEKAESVALCDVASDAKLWKTEGDYLYFYGAGANPVTDASSSGYKLTRINYKGDATIGNKVYENLPNVSAKDDFKPTTIEYVDFASSWYMPEIFGNTLMFANAEAVGTTSYNYVYATSIASTEKIVENNEAYEKVYKYIENDIEDADLQAAMTYYYRVGTQAAIDEVKALSDKELFDYYETFTEFVTAVSNGEYIKESSLIGMLGNAVKGSDVEAMAQAWTDTLPKETEKTEKEEGLETWAICLIVAAAVIVVAAAVVVPVVLLNKKKIAREEAENTVNAYKRVKIDTTDDKSIDVYADDEATATEETKTEGQED